MSNPFKKIINNATESKNTMYVDQSNDKAIVSTRDCDACGAPRPKKSDITICSYCKTAFMLIGKGIKADN